MAPSAYQLFPHDHVEGPAVGVEVILWGSPLCPFAKQIVRVVDDVRGRLPVRFGFRHLYFGADAELGDMAADFCESADLQGAFWPAFRWLLEGGVSALSEPGAFARKAALDLPRFRLDMRNGAAEIVTSHRRLADRAGLAHAPALLVAGQEQLDLQHERLVASMERKWLAAQALRSRADDDQLPAVEHSRILRREPVRKN